MRVRPLVIAAAFAVLIAGTLAAGLASRSAAAPPAAAQPTAPATAEAPSPPAPPDELAVRRAAVASELAALEAQLAGAPGNTELQSRLAREVEQLYRIDHLLADQQDAVAQAADHKQAIDQLDQRLASGARAALSADPPYPIALLDATLDALYAQRDRRAALEKAVADAESQLADARRARDESEEARRKDKEAADGAGPDAAGARARQDLRFAELASRQATESAELAERRLDALRVDLALAQKSETAIQQAVAFIGGHLALAPRELADAVASIDQRQLELREQTDRANQDLASAERRLAAAQKRLDADTEQSPVLAAEVEARRLAQLAAQRRAAFLGEEEARLTAMRQLWERRVRALHGDVSNAERSAWQDEIRQLAADRNRDARFAEARIGEYQRDLEDVRARLAGPPVPEARWLAEQERALDALLDTYRAELAGRDENSRLERRTLYAIAGGNFQRSLAQRWSDLREGVGAVWNRELFAVEDRPITIGKLVEALGLFLIGFALSRAIARTVGYLLRRRAALDEGAASAIQGLSFYFLMALFFLVALRTVNIPLTAFTVAGGALAIGIGFGSQNIVNNFISGIILMAERPIKVGDIVVVEGNSGRVERIGPRSTRIRTFDNTHMIVPNSRFLDTNVVNWTLSDDLVRTKFKVGVAYGSPTRMVEELLRQVLRKNDAVLKNPAPSVLLTDFGDNALQFQVEFWVRVGPLLDKRVVESDVRHAIDDVFRSHGVDFAFPQRDVHLDASRPLPVHVVPPPAEES